MTSVRRYTPREILKTILRRRWFILAPVALGLIASVYMARAELTNISRWSESGNRTARFATPDSGVNPASDVAGRDASPLWQTIVGGVSGLVLGLGLVAVLEYGNTGFSREEEVSRVLMLPVLGTIGVLKTERECRSQRFRRAALDIGGSLLVALAILSVLWLMASSP